MSVCIGNGIICMCDLVYVSVTHPHFGQFWEIKCTGGRSPGTGLGASLIYPTFCLHFVYDPWTDLLWLCFENCAAVLSLHMAVELP